jgi:hypothetical protein
MTQVAWPKWRDVRRVVARHGWVIFIPAHAGAVAKGRSRGGQAAAAAGGQRAGGLASSKVRAQQSEVAQLQAEQASMADG